MPKLELICPDCRANRLEEESVHLHCPGCKRDFAVQSGVKLLWPKSMPAITASEVKYWDQRASQQLDAMAKFYEADHFAIDRWGLYRYKTALLNLPPESRVLEVGCGTNPKSLHLVKYHNLQNLCVSDLSSGQLQANRMYCISKKLDDPVAHVAADLISLPFADDSFDAVLAHAALHHVPDWKSALAEMVRCTKPGGAVILGHEPNKRIVRIQRRFAGALRVTEKQLSEAYSAADEELGGFYPKEVISELRDAGIQDVELLPQWFVLSFVLPLPKLLNKIGIRTEKIPDPVIKGALLADKVLLSLPIIRNWNAHFSVIAWKPVRH
jgi:ubiquinone/menaquinone biosynthesis C-methylase UbiE